jgi:hypothetical protein
MLDVGFKGNCRSCRSLPAGRMSVMPITQLSGSKLLHSTNQKGAPSTSEAARANMRTSLSFWQHNESNHLHHFCRSSEKSDSARMPRSFKQQRGILAAQRARNPGGEGSEGRGSRAGWPGARCREPAFQRGWCAAQRSGQGGERDPRGWSGAGYREQAVQREGMDLKSVDLDRALTDDELATAQTARWLKRFCALLPSSTAEVAESNLASLATYEASASGAGSMERVRASLSWMQVPRFFPPKKFSRLITSPTYSFKTF